MRRLALLLFAPTLAFARALPDTVEVWEVMAAREMGARAAYEAAWEEGSPVIRFSHPSPGSGTHTYTFDRLSLVGGGVGRTVMVDSAGVVTVADYAGTNPEAEFTDGNARGLLSFTGADGLVVEIRGVLDANARPGHLPLSPEGPSWDDRSVPGFDTSLRSHHGIDVSASRNVTLRGATVTNAWFAVFVTYSSDVLIEGVRLVPGSGEAGGDWIGGYLNAALALRGVERGTARGVYAEGASETVDLNDVGFPVTLEAIAGLEVWEAVLEVSGAPDYVATDVSGTNCAAVLNLRPYTGNVARGTVTGALARYTPEAPAWLFEEGAIPFRVHSEATVTGARVEIGPGPSPVRQVLHQATIEGRVVRPHVGRVELDVEADPAATFALGTEPWGAGEHAESVTHYGGDLVLNWRGPVPTGRRLVWSYGAGRVDIETAENTAPTAGTLVGVGTLHPGGLAVSVGSASGFSREVEPAMASDVSGALSTEGQHRPHAAPQVAIGAYGDALLAYADGEPLHVWRNRGRLIFQMLGGGEPDGAAPIVREGVGLEFGPGSSLDWGGVDPDSFAYATHRATLRFRAQDLGTRERRLVGFGGLAPYRIGVSREGVSVRIAEESVLTVPVPLHPARWYVVTVEFNGPTVRARLGAEGEAAVEASALMSRPLPDGTGRLLVGGGRDGAEAPGTLWISHLILVDGSSAEVAEYLAADEALLNTLTGAAPALTFPEADTEVGLPVCLDWQPVPGALAYRLSIGSLALETTETLACFDENDLAPGSSYTWSVQTLAAGGASPVSAPLAFSVRVDPPDPEEPPGEEPGETPEGTFVTAVGRAAPNPARLGEDVASLPLSLERPEIVRVDVFDTRGRRLARAYDGGLETGLHEIPLLVDLPSGVYALVVRIGARPPVTRLLTRL